MSWLWMVKPLDYDVGHGITNAYGRTKFQIEEILKVFEESLISLIEIKFMLYSLWSYLFSKRIRRAWHVFVDTLFNFIIIKYDFLQIVNGWIW